MNDFIDNNPIEKPVPIHPNPPPEDNNQASASGINRNTLSASPPPFIPQSAPRIAHPLPESNTHNLHTQLNTTDNTQNLHTPPRKNTDKGLKGVNKNNLNIKTITTKCPIHTTLHPYNDYIDPDRSRSSTPYAEQIP
eukprot:GHVR01137677.1.p1 GENE.GHVR01137677.1~~GHVR01137677.1.p1  ORF type:complete len:137 (-),score=23.70 GHVR01137677.1:1401-1811(-)